jgi:putative endonuclease
VTDNADDDYEIQFIRYRSKPAVIVGDTIYEIDRWLRNGAEALLARVPWSCNPHNYGSDRHDQWAYGHELAAAHSDLGHKLGGSATDRLASLVPSEWFVYVLVSKKTGRTYVGSATDVTRRLRQHNGTIVGGARCTRAFRPWRVGRVIGPLTDQRTALKEERRVKRLRRRRLYG